MTTTRLLRAPAKVARPGAIRLRTRSWSDWSRLFVMGDALGWALDDEAAYVSGVAHRAGYVLGSAEVGAGLSAAVRLPYEPLRGARSTLDGVLPPSGLAYFHGRPGTRGMPEFDRATRWCGRDHGSVRIQVPPREMEEIVLCAGVPEVIGASHPDRGRLDRFPLVRPEARRAAREALGLPARHSSSARSKRTASGWPTGSSRSRSRARCAPRALDRRPRRTTRALRPPYGARARVRPTCARRARHPPSSIACSPMPRGCPPPYRALDAYLVTSRDEGGPKAVLESMATGVPIVSTRVGQAVDLVPPRREWLSLVDVGNTEALAAAAVARLATCSALTTSLFLRRPAA